MVCGGGWEEEEEEEEEVRYTAASEEPLPNTSQGCSEGWSCACSEVRGRYVRVCGVESEE